MPVRRFHWWLIVLGVFLVAIPIHAQGEAQLIVSPDGPYTTIADAVADASPGDTIEVHGGVYPAPLEITTTGLTLVGVDNPVIDGGGEGSLVIISAPDVTFQGFTVRNSGHTLNHEDCGIIVQAPRVLVADNVLEEVLFGIYFANANDGVARNNTISGIDLDVPLRGDGIRVWYSTGVTLSGNVVTHTRDALIWFAEDITIEGNTFRANRYGLHFMYSSGAQVENNTFQDNSVGSYLMYSDGLVMSHNTIVNNRGPSGYGIALKDMDEVIVADNLFAGNRTGLFLDNSPFSVDRFNHIEDNVFAYNDAGVVGLPAVSRNIFSGNSFLDNLQQTGTHGRGTLQGNTWSQAGQGNYWSDYVGYDADGNGIGDLPYRAEELFESLADEYPVLQLFTFSPAAQAIDFAAAAFPTLRPEPRLIDTAPLTGYVLPAQFTLADQAIDVTFLLVSAVMVGTGIVIALAAREPRPVSRSRHIALRLLRRNQPTRKTIS